jgi:hypothetical protein
MPELQIITNSNFSLSGGYPGFSINMPVSISGNVICGGDDVGQLFANDAPEIQLPIVGPISVRGKVNDTDLRFWLVFGSCPFCFYGMRDIERMEILDYSGIMFPHEIPTSSDPSQAQSILIIALLSSFRAPSVPARFSLARIN